MKNSTSTMQPVYQKESMDLVGGDRNILWRSSKPVTLDSVQKAIEGNIKDLKEIIDRQKDQVYKMASSYEYCRDHSIEISKIKADVTEREISLKAYEHCLRIVKGEQRN